MESDRNSVTGSIDNVRTSARIAARVQRSPAISRTSRSTDYYYRTPQSTRLRRPRTTTTSTHRPLKTRYTWLSEMDDGDSNDKTDDDKTIIDSDSDRDFLLQSSDENDDEEDNEKIVHCRRAPYRRSRKSFPDFDGLVIPAVELVLPTSADDLLVPVENALPAVAVYETLRRFSVSLRITPFLFEDFCAALASDCESKLLDEVHITLLRTLVRADEVSGTMFSGHDARDSVAITIFCGVTDPIAWFELVRLYLKSFVVSAGLQSVVYILDNSLDYRSVSITDRITILRTLTDLFLQTEIARDFLASSDVAILHENQCRYCNKLGDLICCETCPAVYHLTCADPPLSEVPSDAWFCPICTRHQVRGVTDCLSEAERAGFISRLEPLGFDRHGRRYWFVCRRIFVEAQDGKTWYYSSPTQLESLVECLTSSQRPQSVLCELDLLDSVADSKDEIVAQMNATLELTSSRSRRSRTSAIEQHDESLKKLSIENKPSPENLELKSENKTEELGTLKLEITDDGNSVAHDSNSCASVLPATSFYSSAKSKDGGNGLVKGGNSGDLENEGSSDGMETESESGSEEESENQRVVDGKTSEVVDLEATSPISKGSVISSFPSYGESVTKEPKAEAEKFSNPPVTVRVTRSKTGSLPVRPSPEDDTTVCNRRSGIRKSHRRTRLGKSTVYKLGMDSKEYVNLYRTDPLAMSKQQRAEERDKQRHLSYKFVGLASLGELAWHVSLYDGVACRVDVLRRAFIALESALLSPFLHGAWRDGGHSERWMQAVRRCVAPSDFAAALTALAACIKPIVFSSIWKDGIGHTSLRRWTATERDEFKQKERDAKRWRPDDSLTLATSAVRYTLGLRHQVWKQKGEIYRINGNGGWYWVSSTHVVHCGNTTRNRRPSHFSLTIAKTITADENNTACDDTKNEENASTRYFVRQSAPIVAKLDSLLERRERQYAMQSRIKGVVEGFIRDYRGEEPQDRKFLPSAEQDLNRFSRTRDSGLPYVCYSSTCISKKGLHCYSPTCSRSPYSTSFTVSDDVLTALKTEDENCVVDEDKAVGDGCVNDAEKSQTEALKIVQPVNGELDGTLTNGEKCTDLSELFRLHVTGGKIRLTSKIVADFESKSFAVDDTRAKVSVGRRPGISALCKKSPTSSGIPKVHDFRTRSRRHSLFVLPDRDLSRLARRGGLRFEAGGFSYAITGKPDPGWIYPCPRPDFSTAWNYRVVTARNLSAIALALRVLWSCLRWDDMRADTTTSDEVVSLDTDVVTTTRLLRKRDIGNDQLRSEYLVQRTVVPTFICNEIRGDRPTPQRTGLRERRTLDAVRPTQPVITEVWVPEDQLELSEIRQFALRKERPVRNKTEKRSYSPETTPKRENARARKNLELDDSNTSIESDGSEAWKPSPEGATTAKAKRPPTGSSAREITTYRDSSGKVVTLRRPANNSKELTLFERISQHKTPTSLPVRNYFPRASVSVGNSGTSPVVSSGLKIVRRPDGTMTVTGLLPGQELVTRPDGRLQVVSKNISFQYLKASLGLPRSAATVTTATVTTTNIPRAPTTNRFYSSAADFKPYSTKSRTSDFPVASGGNFRVKSATGNGATMQRNGAKGCDSPVMPKLDVVDVAEPNDATSTSVTQHDGVVAGRKRTFEVATTARTSSVKRGHMSAEQAMKTLMGELEDDDGRAETNGNSGDLDLDGSNSDMEDMPVLSPHADPENEPDPLDQKPSSSNNGIHGSAGVAGGKSRDTTCSGKDNATRTSMSQSGRDAGTRSGNKNGTDEELHCICQQPYDSRRFYVGCNVCSAWFHGACVGVTPLLLQKMKGFVCHHCSSQTAATGLSAQCSSSELQDTSSEQDAGSSEELHCLCRTPYDPSQLYIGCNNCLGWFHAGCVSVKPDEVQSMESYFCPRCTLTLGISSDTYREIPSTVDNECRLKLTLLVDRLKYHEISVKLRQIHRTQLDFSSIERRLASSVCYSSVSNFAADVLNIFMSVRNSCDKHCVRELVLQLENYFIVQLQTINSQTKP